MPEKGKARGNSGGGCGKVAKDQSNHLVAGSIRSFTHFQEKAIDLWIRERVVLDLFSGEPLEQVINNPTCTNIGKQKFGDEA